MPVSACGAQEGPAASCRHHVSVPTLTFSVLPSFCAPSQPGGTYGDLGRERGWVRGLTPCSGLLGASLAAEFRPPPPPPKSTETPFETTLCEVQVVEPQNTRWIPRLCMFFILPHALNQPSTGLGVGGINIRLDFCISRAGRSSKGTDVCCRYNVRYHREMER